MIQHFVIKFVSDLWLVSGFPRVLWFPPLIKLHHDITQILLTMALSTITIHVYIHFNNYICLIFLFLDINECKIGLAKCADGTKCFNTPGHYHCEPCSGIQYSIVVITISGHVDSVEHYVIKFVSVLQ